MQTNQFGLQRDIPDPVKREVRQRCGFGCVVCGSAFYQYDHLDPPFAEAKSHEAAGIVLLCGGCHARKTSKRLSEETVRRHAECPAAKQAGFSFGALDIGTTPPWITLGEVMCNQVRDVVVINGETVFSVMPPEEEGGPFRVTALLTDDKGVEALRIVDNELQARTGNWDVELEGPQLTVRRGTRDIVLQLRVAPPHGIIVSRLAMHYRRGHILISQGSPTRIVSASGRQFGLTKTIVKGSMAALLINDDGVAVGYRGGFVQFSLAGPVYEIPPEQAGRT